MGYGYDKKTLKEMLAEIVKWQEESILIRRFAVFVSLWDEIQK